jgi:hypothetical protein
MTVEMKSAFVILPVFVGCLLAATLPNAQAPTSQQLHKMYGEATMERFTVRPGITLTAEYGSDRLACQLLIEPAQLLIEVKDQGPLMSSEAVSQVLEEAVPTASRGRRIDSNIVQIEGNELVRTDYENVSIRRICSVTTCTSSNTNQDVRTLVVFSRSACPRHIQ